MNARRTGKNARADYEASLAQVKKLVADIESGITQFDRRSARSGSDPHYGHIGALDNYAEKLADIADALHKRGEYDPNN